MSVQQQMPKVSVVILNYNTADLLVKLIPYIQKTTYPNFEIIVADNDSTDRSVDTVKQQFPDVKVIELHTNLGFAGGYNKAFEQVDSEFWVLLNSDVEVSPEWLNPMMDLMVANDKVAAIQPKILDYNNRDTFEYAGASGGYIDKWGYPFCRGRMFEVLEKDLGQYNDSRPVFWATGAAMLVRAKDYKTVGGMDDDFFAHMEEIDMCWRFHNIDQQVWVCPDSVVYHVGGGTLSYLNSRKTFLNFRNNLALLTKNLPSNQVLPKLLTRLVLDGIAGVKFILDFKFKHCWAIVKAHWDFFLHFSNWWKKRKVISKHQDPKEISGWFGESIVMEFFVKKKRYFSDLNIKN